MSYPVTDTCCCLFKGDLARACKAIAVGIGVSRLAVVVFVTLAFKLPGPSLT